MTSSERGASGESTIYRDDEGRWHGFVSMGLKENGRRDRRHISGGRRGDVAKVRALEVKRDAGMAGTAGKSVTVAAWLEHWLDTIAARKVRPSTLTRYRQLAAHQLVPAVGHHRLDRLQPEHLEALYAKLLDGALRRRASCRRTGSCPGRSRWRCSGGGSHATSPRWSTHRRCSTPR